MSVCSCVCLSVPKELANCRTDLILLYNIAFNKSWEDFNYYTRRNHHSQRNHPQKKYPQFFLKIRLPIGGRLTSQVPLETFTYIESFFLEYLPIFIYYLASCVVMSLEEHLPNGDKTNLAIQLESTESYFLGKNLNLKGGAPKN